jgi:hypothetical protein
LYVGLRSEVELERRQLTVHHPVNTGQLGHDGVTQLAPLGPGDRGGSLEFRKAEDQFRRTAEAHVTTLTIPLWRAAPWRPA